MFFLYALHVLSTGELWFFPKDSEEQISLYIGFGRGWNDQVLMVYAIFSLMYIPWMKSLGRYEFSWFQYPGSEFPGGSGQFSISNNYYYFSH